MTTKVTTGTGPRVVMAVYRPKSGKAAELDVLIHKHFPTLKEYGLTTEALPYIGRSADGSVIEIFEWISPEAAGKAHDHPAVAKIWEAMAMVAEFGTLSQLPESANRFPSFARAF